MAEAAADPRSAAIDAMRAMAFASPEGRVGRRPRRGAAASARRAGQRSRGIGVALRTNMTPMIDVVFQLLVFFIATTRYAPNERVIAMDLGRRAAAATNAPEAAPAPPPPKDPFALDDESLRLEVAPDGTVKAGPPLRRSLTTAQLREVLAAEIRLPGRAGGMFEPAFPVVVAPADGTPWESAVEALDAATAAGFRNVGFERRPGTAEAGR
ncbi:MAG: ExbD/TolR family protein [Planctomycetota bacterium]